MDLKNWLSLLPGSIPLSMINLPGTHDSSTQFVKLSPFSRCQDKSISQQLEIGIRSLDIRLELRDSRFYAVHGIADCRTSKKRNSPLLCFEDIFEQCAVFLKNNQTETIMLSLKMDRGNNGESFYNSFYRQFVEPNRLSWFLENRIPALSECRGKIVLVRRCSFSKSGNNFNDKNTGLNLTNWPDQGSTKSFSALPSTIESVEGNAVLQLAAVIQDRFMLNPKAKWEKATKPALENAEPNENAIFLHYFSTAGIPFIPLINSHHVNAKFKEFEMANKKYYGWISLDFPTKYLVNKIIESNFSVVIGQK